MSSNRQLLADGAAKRADLVKVRLDNIHIEAGFNPPETQEAFDMRVDAIVAHLAQGGYLPPIEVRPRDEGGVYVVDGHGRRAAYERAAAAGIPVSDPKDGHVYILTTAFVGNDADRVARIVTSSERRTLSPVQIAHCYQRLQAFGWSVDQIAKKVCKSDAHVRQLLDLGSANSDVQKMVTAGEVSASVAIKEVRKSGERAGKVLSEQLATAKAAGKKKVTAGTAEGKKSSAALIKTLLAALEAIIEADDAKVLTKVQIEAGRAAVMEAKGAFLNTLKN
jgi:ParB family chromosome partitioning protein